MKIVQKCERFQQSDKLISDLVDKEKDAIECKEDRIKRALEDYMHYQEDHDKRGVKFSEILRENDRTTKRNY